ncbi:MAG: hypothetical protein JWP47_1038 [Polaromonas sp.]|jgi:hypothetical protein|nr:hypothetical protein [Polaromonas sp.]
MKLVLAALILAAPVLVVAQSAPAAKTADKATTKPAASAKPIVTKPAATKPAATSKAAVRRSALKAVEEVTPIDDDLNFKLSALDLETAGRVHVGQIPCELGAAVTVTADAKRPGFFTVSTKGNRFRMHPVESRTGAIRLEDPKAGALWLQLGNKSMLMSQKMGQRLADECMSPAQLTMADEIKKNPPTSILEPLPVPPVGPAVATPQSLTQN